MVVKKLGSGSCRIKGLLVSSSWRLSSKESLEF